MQLGDSERPTRIAPQRVRRSERAIPPLQAFLRRPRSAQSLARANARKKATAHLQQVIVRSQKMRQPKPGSKRTWARFGRYLERDEANPERAGFTPDREQVPIADELRNWQKTGNEHVQSVILSPEQELDLKEFTRAWIRRVERQYGVTLDWVAAVHNNTEHPHVHVVFKGQDRAIEFSRKDMYECFRQYARETATEFLGYRTREPDEERGFTRDRSRSQDRAKSR